MAKEKYLIVPAGGSGQRMGAAVPKQFLLLGGKPILRLTIERFLDADPDIHVITVLPRESVRYWKDYCLSENLIFSQKIVTGGFTRFHSVKNGLEKVPDGALVAVHDGVRPLVSVKLVRDLFAAAEQFPAVIPAIPSFDTLKFGLRREDGTLEASAEPLDRSSVFSVQTPQIFRSEVLKKAYSQGYSTAFTDDASVVLAAGIPVKMLPGERTNIKITTPEDLSLAERLLR